MTTLLATYTVRQTALCHAKALNFLGSAYAYRVHRFLNEWQVSRVEMV
jgi:hypothetical protein